MELAAEIYLAMKTLFFFIFCRNKDLGFIVFEVPLLIER